MMAGLPLTQGYTINIVKNRSDTYMNFFVYNNRLKAEQWAIEQSASVLILKLQGGTRCDNVELDGRRSGGRG